MCLAVICEVFVRQSDVKQTTLFVVRSYVKILYVNALNK